MDDPAAVQTHTFQTNEYAQSCGEKGFVNFKLGQPGPKLLSLPHFTKACERAFKGERDPTLLAYSDPLGHRNFRASLATWLTKRFGFPVQPNELVMTNGNTHAVDFVVRQVVHAYVNEVSSGSDSARQCAYVAMDDPTYFLAGGVIQRYVDMLNYNGKSNPTAGDQPVLTLRMCASPDTMGLDVDALEKWLDEIATRKQRLLAIYLIPVFQNPTGVSMSQASAERLVALAHKHRFYIISDEPYPFLNFEEGSTDTLVSLACEEYRYLKKTGALPDEGEGGGSKEAKVRDTLGARATGTEFGLKKVIVMGSFSKIFAPGLRLGYLHADPELIEKGFCADPILDSGGGVNPITGIVIREMLEASNVEPQPDFSLDRYIADLVPELKARCGALCGAIRAQFGDAVKFVEPTGGYFLFLRFVADVPGFSSPAFRDFLADNKSKFMVMFLAGTSCRAAPRGTPAAEVANDDELTNSVRLSFAFYEPDELVEGARRLRCGYDAFVASLATPAAATSS